MTRRRLIIALQGGAIAAAGIAIYWPALRGNWISDDTLEVVANRDLRTAAGLGRIWLGRDSPDYFPLKSTVQWLEWHFWGAQPAGYHCVTLGFHLLAAVLLWRLLGRLGVRLAWLGGLLFAVHPLCVESVAWAAELKNTLSLPPLLLACGAYLSFERDRRPLSYIASLAWFVAALLCKTSVVMFPAVLLLYAWWRQGRIDRRDVRHATPFAAASLALGVVTLLFQHQHAFQGASAISAAPLTRVAASGLAAVFYLGKALLPAGLAFEYPRWALNPPALWDFLPWLAFAAAASWLVSKAAPAGAPPDWRRHVGLGAGWFLVNLIPVAGFFPMSYQRFSWVADHLAYVPLLGLVGLVAAGAGALAAQPRRRPAVLLIAAAIIVGFSALSRAYAATFVSETALWTRTLEQNPGAALAHNNLGIALDADGRRPEAIREFQRALELTPEFPEARTNLGSALLKDGRIEEAIPQFQEALRLDPEYALPRNNLGEALHAEGRNEEAAAAYRSALALDPEYAEADYNLGLCLSALGQFGQAIDCYQAALHLQPELFRAENNLGFALYRSGRLADAMIHYRRALQIHPEYPEAEDNLGVALAQSGRVAEAIGHFQAALRLNPDFAAARRNLQIAQRTLERAGQMP